jgi:hypothetical protein
MPETLPPVAADDRPAVKRRERDTALSFIVFSDLGDLANCKSLASNRSVKKSY